MKHAKVLFRLLAIPAFVGAAFAAPGDNIAPGKVVSKAEIWLPVKTRISGFSLPAGQYLMQHRLDGPDHMMSFIQLRAGTSRLGAERRKFIPAMVKCGLEPLQIRASQTAFYSVAEGEANRAIKLEIRGEAVAHVFPIPVSSTPSR